MNSNFSKFCPFTCHRLNHWGKSSEIVNKLSKLVTIRYGLLLAAILI